MRVRRGCFPIAGLLGFVLLTSSGAAPLKLAPLFSDNMVLQAGMPVPIWGVAGAGEKVTVELVPPPGSKQAGQTATATADDKGEWKVELSPLKADSQPGELRVAAGANTLTVTNVLIGEVWLFSGQSNMSRHLGLWGGQSPIENWEQEVAAADHPQIRQFLVKGVNVLAKNGRPDSGGRWMVCSPTNAPAFSAVGYFFARELHKARKVPVGIVLSAEGNTPAELWLSKEALAAIPDAIAKHPEVVKRYSRHYNGGIAPLMPLAMRGVAWYQGESNVSVPMQYETVLTTLIESWRKAWGREFPFLFVQLPPQGYVPPEFREGQLRVSQNVPNTAMVVTADVGYKEKPLDWHPPRKAPVGERLALAARAIAYGEKIESSGPIYKDMQVSGSTAVLSFTHVGGGLAAKDGELTGFEVAGADGKFVKATAVIQGDKVAVSSPDVSEPAAVRYGWGKFFEANLFNKAGLPASPFRTGP